MSKAPKPWRPIDFNGEVDPGLADAMMKVEPSWDARSPNWDSVYLNLLDLKYPPEVIADMTQSLVRQAIAKRQKVLIDLQGGLANTHTNTIVSLDFRAVMPAPLPSNLISVATARQIYKKMTGEEVSDDTIRDRLEDGTLARHAGKKPIDRTEFEVAVEEGRIKTRKAKSK